MRRITYSLLLSLTAVAAACGGDDGDDGDGVTPDAGPDAPPSPDGPIAGCGTPVTTISTYPATYDGVVLGAGNDLTVDDGACTDQRDYYGSDGDDHVLALTGLTAGERYLLQLTTQEDIMMYVTEDCTGGQPSAGSCLLLVDQTTRNEVGDFIAPADGTVTVVIDTPDGVTLTTGMYTLAVREAQCLSSFDCDQAATPVCDLATNVCVAGAAMCTGDDAAEPDDGPADANVLAYPTAVPSVFAGAVCNVPATEADWFRITAPAAATLRIAATWTNSAADLDFVVYDATGEAIATADAVDFDSEAALIDLPGAGDYYIELYPYDPMNTAAATAYSLSVGLPECQTSFDCDTGAAPVCETGGCVAGPSACTGDDVANTTPGTSDDGPAGARVLATVVGVPTTVTGSACNVPEGGESDWYRVTTTAHGQGITARLSWTAMTGIDLDVYIFDAMGNLVGMSFWLNPEVVTTSYLPMGTYYVNVVRFDSPMTAPEAAYAYSLEVTRTAAQTCTTTADCADEHLTQVYRGTCNGTTGACEMIAPGTRANGMACDSGDDCMSGDCSYIVFEADAQKSVCTSTCTTTADCAAVGTGFTCTTGFQTNVCVPTCAADLECGANLGSGTLDTGLPWNYLTCTLPAGTCGP